jgi:phage shock protein A
MPTIPSPFSAFLEEKAGGDRSLKQLENERNHIHETVKGMRDRLKLLDKRIAEIKKETKPDSSSEAPVQ